MLERPVQHGLGGADQHLRVDLHRAGPRQPAERRERPVVRELTRHLVPEAPANLGVRRDDLLLLDRTLEEQTCAVGVAPHPVHQCEEHPGQRLQTGSLGHIVTAKGSFDTGWEHEILCVDRAEDWDERGLDPVCLVSERGHVQVGLGGEVAVHRRPRDGRDLLEEPEGRPRVSSGSEHRNHRLEDLDLPFGAADPPRAVPTTRRGLRKDLPEQHPFHPVRMERRFDVFARHAPDLPVGNPARGGNGVIGADAARSRLRPGAKGGRHREARRTTIHGP